MGNLAIRGGSPVRSRDWPKWPIFGDEERRLLMEVLESGYWGGGVDRSGPWEERFEGLFAQRHGCKYGICVASGTAALHAALLAVGVGPGDEVIAPALTFWATGSAVLMTGATLVVVDVDPDTYCMDVGEVERAISPSTKAIIPVYNYGTAPDMDEISRLAGEGGIAVIEDCARAHGFAWRQRPAGSIGDAGCFSFQQGKFMTAGEGGIVVTSSEVVAERCRAIRSCGRLRGELYDVGVEYWLNWFNYRMTQFQAALLLAQLGRLDEQLRVRQENSEYLSKRLEEVDGITPVKVDERLTSHQPWPYAFKYDAKAFRGVPVERFVQALRAEGIPCSGLDHQPLHMTLAARGYSRVKRRGRYPVAEKACSEAVTLPQWIFLGGREDMDDVAEAVEKIRRHSDEL